MNILKYYLLLILTSIGISSFGQYVPTSEVIVHDPVMMEEDGVYYLFTTGHGISVWSSTDLKQWKREKPVFSNPLQWAVDTIPDFKDHIWAPDIYFHNGLYYLYYSVSAFGKNTSAIGVATNKTLNPNSKNFQWIDHGKVIQSYPTQTNWNAIDPNIIDDDKGDAYMAFGSFWDGLKLIKLSEDRLSIAEDPARIPTIASRKKNPNDPNPPSIDDNPKDAGGNAIEAPFLFKKDGYYYLFASIDYCCKGVRSSYKMIVGRAKDIHGPYLDDNGQDLAKAGGKILLQGDERWHGVGHNAVVTVGDLDYLIFHGYDGNDEGKPKLHIEPLKWDNHGWPVGIDTTLDSYSDPQASRGYGLNEAVLSFNNLLLTDDDLLLSSFFLLKFCLVEGYGK